MSTERFSLTDFEDALPKHKETREPLWLYAGFVDGEETFTMEVKNGVLLYIRSSIKDDGYAAPTAKDSIRISTVMADTQEPLVDKKAKVQRWCARTKRWRENLERVLREEWKMAMRLGPCPCGKGMRRLFRVRKDGPSKGKLFIKCSADCRGGFEWVG